MKFSLVLLVLGLLSSAVFGESSEEFARKFEAHEYAAVVEGLERMRSENPGGFLAGDFDYLLGRAAEAELNFPLAMASYHSVAARESALRLNALRRLAHIARSTGNLLLESLYLREIGSIAPDTPAASIAEARLAYNSFERGNFVETVRMIRSPRFGGVVESRDMGFLFAGALLGAGEADDARPILENLVGNSPGPAPPDDLALGAAKSLDAMDGGETGKNAPQVTEAEHVRRAAIYQANREFAAARLHYDAIIAKWPQSLSAAEALLNIGRGHAQLGDFAEAIKWFERVLELHPQSPAAKEALLQAASAYGRVSREKEATNRYEVFIAKYPEDERVERAYFNIVDILRDQGSDTEAIRECERISDKFRGKRAEALAYFSEARVRIAREEWREAIDGLDKLKSQTDLGGAAVPGGTSQTEVAFLRALALEGAKEYAAAVDAHLSIPDGAEYYGQRADKRLTAMAANEASSSFIDQAIGRFSAQLNDADADAKQKAARALLRLTANAEVRNRAIAVLTSAAAPASKRPANQSASKNTPSPSRPPTRDLTDAADPAVRRLAELGLYDEAVAATTQTTTDPAKPASPLPVELYERAGRADLVIEAVEPQWRSTYGDKPADLIPKEQLRRFYPVAFVDELLRSSAAHKVDPRLLLAIMRQESRFRNNAKSNAAARGLMQFIASTATKVAAELGRENFRQDDLYDPSTAIELGARYLKDLYTIFPDQTEAVVASYNGGDDNMKRWLARSRSNRPERYVPEIQYAQSKDYVHKVMASYWMYQRLYDENLRPT
jgi:soluble lytic murein transglycosylase